MPSSAPVVAPLDLGSLLGHNLADPASAQDVATKHYVDGQVIVSTWTNLNNSTNQATVYPVGTRLYETDTGFTKISDGLTQYQALNYVRSPNIWTPATQGLTAATLDGAGASSNSGVTTGRPMFMPTRIDTWQASNTLFTGYVSQASTITVTNTYLGVYDGDTGALLVKTPDISSQFVTLASGNGTLVKSTFDSSLASTLTNLPIGKKIYLALLMNYTGSGTLPQIICDRLLGTDLMATITGAIPRLYTNSSGSTMTALPSTLPTLGTTTGNELWWVGLSQ
jgi:hypothetical protein